MPKVPPKLDSTIAAAVAAREAFFDPSGWRASKRTFGNVWRLYEGVTLSIFRRRDSLWGWCIADGDEEKRFAPVGYETIDDAKSALADALEIGAV